MSLVKIEPYITDNVASFTFGGLTITANAVFGNTNLGNVSTANFVTVSSNITSGNANLGNLAVANYFSGNGSLLTGISASSLVSGNSNIKLVSNGNASVSIGGTSNVVIITTTGVNISGYLNATNVIGEGGNLSNIQGANVSGTVSSATSATTAGTVTTAAQPNITSVGLLTGLSVNGTANVIGNVGIVGNASVSGSLTANSLSANNITTSGSGGNISGANNISANTFTASTGITGNGVINFINSSNVSLGAVGNVKVTGGSSGQYLQTDGTGNLSWVTLSISGSSISNGTSNVNIPNANGNVNISAAGNANVLVVTGTGVNIAGTLTANGTLTAGNLTTSGSGGNISGANNVSANTFTGVLTTASQTNITSVGTLTTLAIAGTGNVSGANLVSANYITGTLTTAAQPNITSLGSLTGLTVSGDTTITGNLTVTGNYEYANVTSFKVKDTIIEQGGNVNGLLTTNDGFDRGQLLHYYSGGAVDAFMGWKNSSQEFIFGSNVSLSGEVVTVNTYGNIHAGYIIGNGSQLTGLSTITVANANYSNFAGTVINASQPNITSVGTLTSLSVTGNITAGNVAGGNLVNASYFKGDGSLLTSLTGANVTGNVPYAITSNYANTANSVSGANVSGNVNYAITSNWANIANSVSGTNVSGNVNYAITSNWANTANSVSGTNVSGNVNYAITSNYANTANSVSGTNVSGNVTYAITSNYANTANSVSGTNVSGNVNYAITSNYANTANAISGTNVSGQVGNATIAGTVYTNAQPNITSVGTLSSLSITGNLSAGNASLGNSVVANYFTGSGAGLTSVIAVTAATVTTNAQPAITSVGTLTSLIVGNATANSTFGNGTITASGNISFTGSNVSLGSISNLKITGGTAGYFMTTDGNGNLSWGNAAGGSGVSATGTDKQIQFNDGGALGASANLTFDKTTKTLTVDKAVHVSGANLGINVSNIYIGGGGVSQILATDGSGNLTWVSQPVATITVDNFTGDGSTVAYTLSTTPANINQTIVNYNGVFQLRTSAYTLSGPTLTFTEAPLNGSKIEVTTTMGSTSGSGAFVTRTYSGTGSQTAYTVTSGVTVSSVLVTENGLVQTPTTDYTISGTTLTFATAPANGVVIQIRELAIAIATTVSPAYRAYTGNGVQNTFTVTSGLTANSLIVAENGILQRPTTDYTVSGSTLTFATAPNNGVDIQIRELSLNGGMSTGSGSLPYQGGNSGKYLTTDGATASWATVSSSSSLTIKDEGSNLTTSVASIDFVGAGVTATNSGNAVTVTVSSGSGGASNARVTGYNLVFGG